MDIATKREMDVIDEQLPTLPTEQEYPKPTADGFVYRNKDDENSQAEWKEYENENEVMRVTLRRGKTVMVRQLNASEMQKVRTVAAKTVISGEDREAILNYAVVHFSATFDGKQKMIEDIVTMNGIDFGRIIYATGVINF